MNGKQRAVLWLGLIMVGLNLAMKWSSIRSIIFAGAGSVAAPSGGSTSGGGSGGGNSVQVPIDPLLPTGPKITIPLPHL